MPDVNLEFCRELLRQARRDAKAYAVKIPRNLVALRSATGQWFVQGKGDAGLYVGGDNAYHARANYIEIRIREAHPQLESEEQ